MNEKKTVLAARQQGRRLRREEEEEDEVAMQQEEAGYQPWGYQLIIDCFGCSEEICSDLNNGYEFLDQICEFLEMTKQTQPYIFKTCERTFSGRPGYSGWIPIIESGIQIHTSARNKFISIDIYSCKLFDQSKVEQFVTSWFRPEKIGWQFFHRGRDFRLYSCERLPGPPGERHEMADV